MNLEKLTIKYEQGAVGSFKGEFVALFNPTQLSYARSVKWTEEATIASSKAGGQCKRLVFESTDPETFTISLFFDTYDGDPGGAAPSSLLSSLLGASGASQSATSVLSLTQAVAALAQEDTEMHRPPVCVLQWGKVSLFKGVLTSLSQQLLLFLADGTPVRAQLDCTFQELRSGTVTTRGELHSADVAKRYTVLAGDTLLRIASDFYGDQAEWRRIADANALVNPRLLTPGQVLAIPPIP